jgi:alkylmercury lyase
VGAALTLNPSPHRFRVNGNELYAWCALDTIFLPGLLGETAEVESPDPITGETIRLTIAPDGVRDYRPTNAVLSIAVPGVSCSREQTGPQSDACRQIHFFRARETAETWLKDHPGLAIFTVEEAWQLANEGWLARKRRFDAGEAVHCCACGGISE